MVCRSALLRAMTGGIEGPRAAGAPETPPSGALSAPAHARSLAWPPTTPLARGLVGLAVLGSLLAVGACGSEPSATEQATPRTTVAESRPSPTAPSATNDPDEAAAAEAAIAVYRDLTELIQDARRNPTEDWLPAYSRLAADPYRSAELLEISALRDRGVAHSGEVRNEPEVSDVDLAGGTDGTLRTVTIDDCVDTRDFPATVVSTGEVFSVARPPHVAVATVVFYPPPEERWLVATVEVQDETC